MTQLAQIEVDSYQDQGYLVLRHSILAVTLEAPILLNYFFKRLWQ